MMRSINTQGRFTSPRGSTESPCAFQESNNESMLDIPIQAISTPYLSAYTGPPTWNNNEPINRSLNVVTRQIALEPHNTSSQGFHVLWHVRLDRTSESVCSACEYPCVLASQS